jgi:hypothetical protein
MGVFTLSIVAQGRRSGRLVFAAAAAAFIAVSTLAFPAAASAAPVGCTSDFYIATNSASITQRATDGTTTSIPTGALTVLSVALDPADGNLYALSSDPATGNHIFRVASDGTSTDLGAVAGLPGGVTYPAFGFGPDGTAWIAAGALYGIDITGMTATKLTLSGGGIAGDIAFVGNDMYGWGSGNRIAHVDTTTGVVTTATVTGLTAIGATWSSDGHVYVGQGTNVREVVGYNTATPTLATVATLAVGAGDGASCATAASPFLAALNDDYTSAPISAATGGTTASVLANDVASGAAVVAADVTPTLTSDGGLSGATLGADGTITVPAGATAGAYTLAYSLCLVAAPTVCDPATVTLLVRAPAGATPPATPAGPSLATTGTDPTPLAVTGFAALLLGAVILIAARRTRLARASSPARRR